jgi:hypothetical protein
MLAKIVPVETSPLSGFPPDSGLFSLHPQFRPVGGSLLGQSAHAAFLAKGRYLPSDVLFQRCVGIRSGFMIIRPVLCQDRVGHFNRGGDEPKREATVTFSDDYLMYSARTKIRQLAQCFLCHP